jgi:predicted dehydrogenase
MTASFADQRSTKTRDSVTSDEGVRHEPETVRIAVVGLGYWGPSIVRNVVEIPEAELVAVCDLQPSALEKIRRRHNVQTTTSFDEILDDLTIDAVAIATPVSSHYRLAAAALDAGKHVFVEKPLAASSAEVKSLIRLANEQALVLMPGHTFIYSPPVNYVRNLITSGELGDIYFISMSRVNLGLHRHDANVVWDLGPHDFSILRYWLGELPSEVSAFSRGCILPDTPDVAFINLTFGGGMIAHVELSWLAPSKLRRTAVVGSEKMVVYDDTSTEPVRVFDSGVLIPDPQTFGEFRLTYRTGDIVSPCVESSEPLALELTDFCNAIRNGTVPRSSAELGLDVVRVVEAVDESLDGGGIPVSVSVGEPLWSDSVL